MLDFLQKMLCKLARLRSYLKKSGKTLKNMKKITLLHSRHSGRVKAVELSYVPLYHAVYSLYGAFFGIFHTLMSIFSVR